MYNIKAPQSWYLPYKFHTRAVREMSESKYTIKLQINNSSSSSVSLK